MIHHKRNDKKQFKYVFWKQCLISAFCNRAQSNQVIENQANTRFSSEEMMDWTSSWSNVMNSGCFRMAFLLEDTKVSDVVAIDISLQVLTAFLKL